MGLVDFVTQLKEIYRVTEVMVKSLRNLLLFIGLLLVSGPQWAAPPGSKIDCNKSLILTELQPLDFGGFVASGAGTVTIDPATGMRSATGLVTLTSSGGQPGIIEVSVATANDCTAHPVGIILPRNVTLSDALRNTITLDTWISVPLDNAATLGPGNAPLLIYVGATATVAAGQVGGTYTGPYTVKISF